MSGPGQARENADAWWNSLALSAIEHLARTRATFTVHDLAAEVGLIDPDAPCRWGMIMRLARLRGVIECVGAVESRKPNGAVCLVRLWRGRGDDS